MNQDFDIFDRAEKPSMTLCNPDKVEIYSLDIIQTNAISLFALEYNTLVLGIKDVFK